MGAIGSVEMVKIEVLEYDIENPRIAHVLDMFPNPTPAQINLALRSTAGESKQSGSSFVNLRESIKTKGGLINPIIVNRQLDEKMVVIEGNTRLAIYKDFQKRGVQGDWDLIPAIIHNNIELAEIDSIRLQTHLVGPRDWRPYAKAKYLERLSKSSHLTISQIVEFCGGKKREILDFIDAYNDMEHYYRPYCKTDEEFDERRFSSFVELQKSRIKPAISSAGFSEHDFAGWVYNRLMTRNEHVRDLPKVLGNPKAKDVFLNEGMESALKLFVSSDDTDFQKLPIEKIARILYEKLIHIEWNQVVEMRENPDSEKTENMLNLLGQLQILCDDIVE